MMLLPPVRLTLLTHVVMGKQASVLTCERRSERHQGAGNLSLMGIRNISFHVRYDIVLIRVTSGEGGAMAVCSGKVHRLPRNNGRPLPGGTYSLDGMPECRLAHFGRRWTLQFS